MCEDCGCGVVREVEIDGQPGRTVSSPLIRVEGGAEHSHPHEHDHEHDHPHDHDHAPSKGGAHEHPHAHDHAHGHPHDHLHDQEHRVLAVNETVLASNDRQAERNRGFFHAKKLLVLNVLSSPGSGKTTFIQKTIEALGSRLRAGVVVGDLATDNDAARLRQTGAPVVQITTGTVCHLDAEMVARSMGHLPVDNLDILVIENVGNLVCPAAYDLGEELRVALLSVTEGEDKPLKYPPLFHSAQVAVISKLDLAPAVEFARETALANLRRISPGARVFEVSAKTGAGLPDWVEFLVQKHRETVASPV